MLSEPEIQALPEDIRAHYRTSGTLRSLDDLVWFPPGKRAALEALAARGAARTIERIRQAEGDTAADDAAREVEAARQAREHQVGSARRAS